MNLVFYLIMFVFGACVGSFLNCVIYRLETKRSFLIGRSFCPKCKHSLFWRDLIPVLSFIMLRGKCKYCGEKISWQYPVVEIATGALFLLIFNFHASLFSIATLRGDSHFVGSSNFQNLCALVYLLTISSLLTIIFVFDFKHYIIPDKVIYPAILVSGVWYLVFGIFFNHYNKYEILNTINAAFGAGIFFFLIWSVSQGKWMGFGDVKLAFFLGLFLGFPNILVALFSSFLIGAIIGLGLIIFGKKRLKSQVPFGPFLATGTFIALFWGKEIIDWYFSFV